MQVLINIDVDDLERAVAFYRSALGLHPGRRLFAGTVAEMLGAAAPILLLAKPQGSMASVNAAVPRDYRRHWTPVHLDFVVDDLEIAVQTALDAGATQEGGIQYFNGGRFATMSDPFGHGFCLLQLADGGYRDAG